MKIITLIFIAFIILPSCKNKSDELLKTQSMVSTETGTSFLFPKHFGKAINIKAEIIERPMTYYARNYNKTPFYLKVLEVEGKKLKAPIIVELKTESKKKYKYGSIQNLYVYERLREVGSPRVGDFVPQMDLHYRNQLVQVLE